MLHYVSWAVWMFAALFVCLTLPSQPSHAQSLRLEAVDTDGDTGGYSSIAVAGGNVWIVYTKDRPSGVPAVRIAVLVAGGWQFEPVPEGFIPITEIILDPTGYPAFGIMESSAMYYAFKQGGNWTTETVGGFGPWAALTTNDAGILFAAYVWSYHYYGYVSVSSRVDVWTKLRQYEDTHWFNPPTGDVDIAIDSHGRPHICVNPAYDDFYYFCQTATGWSGWDAVPYYLSGMSLAVDSQDRPMIAYKADGGTRLAVKDSTGWTTTEIDGAGCGGLDLEIDADDVPHVVYCRTTGGVPTGYYAVRSGPGGAWVIEEIEEGYAGTLALDHDGQPHIAYSRPVHHTGGWNLKYATTLRPVPVESKSWGAMKSLYGKDR